MEQGRENDNFFFCIKVCRCLAGLKVLLGNEITHVKKEPSKDVRDDIIMKLREKNRFAINFSSKRNNEQKEKKTNKMHFSKE